VRFSVFPLLQLTESLKSKQWGRERSGVYHSFFRAQATSYTRHLFCSHRTPGASELSCPSCPSQTRKHALTNVCLFTSMSPLLGVRGMLGASQFADVVLFRFSGPNVYLSAQPLLRRLSRDSTTASFFSSCPRRTQIDFNGARGRTYALPRRNGGGPLTNDSRKRAAPL
jgi:hypothetical protein